MPTISFVARIKKDWRYPHRENAYLYADRPPAGFQATEPPDWVTGTVRGTIPAPETQKGQNQAPGLDPDGAVGSLFD